eukprot:gene6285-7536_t
MSSFLDPELPEYDLVDIGPQGLRVSSLGLSCTNWEGSPQDVAAFIAAVDGGVTLFDTASDNGALLGTYVNGWCQSEAALLPGAEVPRPATCCEVLNVGVRDGGGLTLERAAVVDALTAHNLNTGGVGGSDVGICHLAIPMVGGSEDAVRCQVAIAEGLKEAQEKGLCSANIGVVGYKAPELEALAAALGDASSGGPRLVSNRVKYSLLDRQVEVDGTLEACRGLGVGVLAGSVLAGGKLKAAAETEQGEGEGSNLNGLLKLLDLVGSFEGGRTPVQVAINWLIAQGVVPLVSTRNELHAWECKGAMGWRLDAVQVEALSERAVAVSQDDSERPNGIELLDGLF